MTLPFALWVASSSIDFEMPCLHPNSFLKMQLESFFTLQPLQYDLIMIKREHKSFCSRYCDIHSFPCFLSTTTGLLGGNWEISINFPVRIDSVQSLHSQQCQCRERDMGALTSWSSKVQPQEWPAKILQQLCPCSPGNAKLVESGYHPLVILFTKIFRQPQDTHTSLAPQHYRQHKCPYPNANFCFPLTNTWVLRSP